MYFNNICVGKLLTWRPLYFDISSVSEENISIWFSDISIKQLTTDRELRKENLITCFDILTKRTQLAYISTIR